MKSIENAVVQKDFIQKIIDNKKYNKTIIEHYLELQREYSHSYARTLQNKIERLDDCNKFWTMDKYREQKIKILKKQNLCRDKFCSNCKKVTQAARMAKYNDELKKYKEQLHHLTLTLPNCNGEELSDTIKNMSKAFKYLVEYLRGKKKTKGLDFLSWGYEGAVRSLEVTFRGDSYHPHFHVGIVLDPEVLGRKIIENPYSFDNRGIFPELKRLFCEKEILIQKIWRLLIDGQRVNLKNIEALQDGYSCTIDKFQPEKYAELFKYMTKEKDEKGEVLTYENFKALYIGLYRVKQIQGYGCLYRISDNNIDIEAAEDSYKAYLEELRQKESPIEVLETPEELILDNECKIINRKSYYKYYKDIIA